MTSYGPIDAETAFTTSNVTLATTAKSVIGDPVEIDVAKLGPFRAVFRVSNVTLATTTADGVVLGVETSVTTSFANPIVLSLPAVKTTGTYVLPLSGDQVAALGGSAHKHIRAFGDPDANTTGVTIAAAFLDPSP